MKLRQFGLPLFILLVAAVLVTTLLNTRTDAPAPPPDMTTAIAPVPAPTDAASAQPAYTTTPTTSTTGQAGALDQMVVKLEQRLQQSDGSAQDWALLGKTYQYLGRTAEAETAYSNALARGYDANRLSRARAEMRQQQAPPPQASPLPNNINTHQLAALTQGLATHSDTTSIGITGTLTLSPALASQRPAAAILYIFARSAQGPQGPPYAVLRVPAVAFPLSFKLNDSHAVVPGRTLSSATEVVIGARLSASGNASGQPGDLEGFSQPIRIPASSPVQLEINQTRP